MTFGMNKWMKWALIAFGMGLFFGGCANNAESTDAIEVVEVTPLAPIVDTLELTAVSTTAPLSTPEVVVFDLPERSGPRTQTSGTVPHVQIGVVHIDAINEALARRAFSLPGVENRPMIVSLPGAQGMWLSDELELARPEVIVAGREFAHIHPDGSLHAPLPFERSIEVAEKGWGERHPWADEREGWDGFVMLFTPQNNAELDIIFQLIVESYNHVTGQTLVAADFE
ncbi:MAG: luciferase family protein [Chloroflexota bacterium]